MNKNNRIVIALLVILIALVAYVAFKPSPRNNSIQDQSSFSYEQSVNSTSGQQIQKPLSVPTQPMPSSAVKLPVSNTKTYSDSSFGYSITYPENFTVSTDSSGVITLRNPSVTTNPTTITKLTGSAPNGSGKFGSYTISYNNGWVVQQQDEQSGDMVTNQITPIAYTNSGLPIFGSNTGHGFGMYGYVVALSHTKFLKIYGSEDSNFSAGQYDLKNDSIFALIKTITTP